MEIILPILLMILVFLVVATFLAALTIGIGFLLTMCVASLQLGHGVITGAIVTAAALYFFLRFYSVVNNISDDDEDISAPVFVIPKDFSLHRPQSTKSKRKKK
jgi:hypothetical protein